MTLKFSKFSRTLFRDSCHTVGRIPFAVLKGAWQACVLFDSVVCCYISAHPKTWCLKTTMIHHFSQFCACLGIQAGLGLQKTGSSVRLSLWWESLTHHIQLGLGRTGLEDPRRLHAYVWLLRASPWGPALQLFSSFRSLA